MRLKAIIAVLILSILLVFLFGKKLDVTQVPQKSDLIVCLGGGYIERLQKGVELFKKGFSNKLVFTGSGIGTVDSRDKIGFWKRVFFEKNGISSKKIVFLENMQNTYHEIKTIKEYMLKHKHKTVLIISDPPHSKRIQYLVNLFQYEENRLKARVVGSDVWWWNKYRYIDSLRAFWEALKEIIALVYYYLRYPAITLL